MIESFKDNDQLKQATRRYIKGGEAIKKGLLYNHIINQENALKHGFESIDQWHEEREKQTVKYLDEVFK